MLKRLRRLITRRHKPELTGADLGRRYPDLEPDFAPIFDITIVCKLSPTQLPLNDHLEPGALNVERLKASLGRWALVEEMLKDPASDPGGALVGAQDHGELDTIALGIPAGILRELEK